MQQLRLKRSNDKTGSSRGAWLVHDVPEVMLLRNPFSKTWQVCPRGGWSQVGNLVRYSGIIWQSFPTRTSARQALEALLSAKN